MLDLSSKLETPRVVPQTAACRDGRDLIWPDPTVSPVLTASEGAIATPMRALHSQDTCIFWMEIRVASYTTGKGKT